MRLRKLPRTSAGRSSSYPAPAFSSCITTPSLCWSQSRSRVCSRTLTAWFWDPCLRATSEVFINIFARYHRNFLEKLHQRRGHGASLPTSIAQGRRSPRSTWGEFSGDSFWPRWAVPSTGEQLPRRVDCVCERLCRNPGGGSGSNYFLIPLAK